MICTTQFSIYWIRHCSSLPSYGIVINWKTIGTKQATCGLRLRERKSYVYLFELWIYSSCHVGKFYAMCNKNVMYFTRISKVYTGRRRLCICICERHRSPGAPFINMVKPYSWYWQVITSIMKCEIELILPFIYIMYIIYNPDVKCLLLHPLYIILM